MQKSRVCCQCKRVFVGLYRPRALMTRHQTATKMKDFRINDLAKPLSILPMVLICAAFGQATPLASNETTVSLPAQPAAVNNQSAVKPLPDLPSMPSGQSTVIGGEIKQLDRVRDQIVLRVFGGHAMKVAFDIRTQIFRDGKLCEVKDLHAGDHISVETMLDGSTVFARSIHSLTQAPEGEVQGQVIEFDRSRGELVLRDSLSSNPVKLRVPAGVQIAGVGQAANAATPNLAPGTLVTADFEAGGGGVVRRISILATPGGSFVFSGKIAFLDVHSGRLAIIDPRDQKRYDVTFDQSHLPVIATLREGNEVTISASFDGRTYTASQIAVVAPNTSP